MPRVERQGVLRHIRECEHFWVDYVTLHMPQQGPPLQIEACRLCGVQRKKPAD